MAVGCGLVWMDDAAVASRVDPAVATCALWVARAASSKVIVRLGALPASRVAKAMEECWISLRISNDDGPLGS